MLLDFCLSYLCPKVLHPSFRYSNLDLPPNPSSACPKRPIAHMPPLPIPDFKRALIEPPLSDQDVPKPLQTQHIPVSHLCSPRYLPLISQPFPRPTSSTLLTHQEELPLSR